MSDIFISYSRKDSEQALRLASFLVDRGHSVWIDQSDIHAAALWSSEIVRAISECRAFILLLSAHSVQSKNVVRELALASEKSKHILPIRLENVTIPEAMEYQLAGIQRLPFGHEDALLHALQRLGLADGGNVPSANAARRRAPLNKSHNWRLAVASIAIAVASASAYFFLEAPAPHPAVYPSKASLGASLMIMPLEDLSRSHNLGYFADGLVSELVHSLSSIRGIRMVNQTTSFAYRGASAKDIAEEKNLQYLLEGSVRSSGPKLRILLQLYDENKGTYLWKDEFEGTIGQIFEMQESIARKVLTGMQLSLSTDEDYRLSLHGNSRFEPHMTQ